MSETRIRPGQRWRSNDGRRVVVVTKFAPYWDDVQYLNEATGRPGAIYAANLRKRYTLLRGERSDG